MSRRSERIAHDQECNLIPDGCVQDCVHALRKREFNDSRTESLQGVEQGLKHLFNALAIRDFDRLSVERALPADEWTIYDIHEAIAHWKYCCVQVFQHPRSKLRCRPQGIPTMGRRPPPVARQCSGKKRTLEQRFTASMPRTVMSRSSPRPRPIIQSIIYIYDLWTSAAISLFASVRYQLLYITLAK